MIRISVIIPVFNREDTLRCCLDSICAQTIDKKLIEILLVDDCSTDNSFEICKEYEKKYPYIHTFQTSFNSKGASVPRNIGIKHAKGEYVFFVDSDDWLGNDCLRRLLFHAEKEGSDYVEGRAIEVNRLKRKGSINWMRENVHEYTDVEYASDVVVSASLTCTFKLIRRDLIVNNKIFFPPELYHYEDYIVTIQILHYAEKVYLANDYDYYYIRRDEGFTSKVSEGPLSLNKRPENQFKAIDNIFSLFDSLGYDHNHALLIKLFAGPVRLAILRADSAAKADPATHLNSDIQYTEMIWNRVRSYYSPNVRSKMRIPYVCWFDAIEAGLGYERYNDPILYYLRLQYPKKRFADALATLSEIKADFSKLPQFLSEEAKVRLLAAQAVEYIFYCSIDSTESKKVISGEYFLPLKVSDGYSVEIKPRSNPDFKPLIVTLIPSVWGEQYQERGTWQVTIDCEEVSTPRDLDVLIKYHDIVVTKKRVESWDDILGQPKKEDAAAIRKRLDNMQKQLAKSRETIMKMQNSRSWKITKPLRRMRGHG